ncbi:MAG TPA: hypothetical protein VGK83_09590 [Acidimicrobiia bacterium]
MPSLRSDEEMTTLPDEPRHPNNPALLINSALCSAIGIVVAVLADSLGRLLLGFLLDRGPVLYHDRVEFTAGDNPLALAGGALAALIAGGAFLAVYPGSRRHDASRLCVLWLILHSFRQGFVPMAQAGIDRDSDLALALAYFDLPAGINVVVGVAGAIGLLLVSLAAAPAFLAFATSRREISSPSRRVAFVAKIAVIAGLAGALLAVIYFLPDSGNGLISALPLYGLFTMATLLAAPGTKSVDPDQGATAQRFSWGLVGAVVILFVLFRFALSRGIPIPPDPQTFFVT